ncbi:peptidase C39 family protein [Nocardioides terrisoli]|uniref:peptidase C39 family protein n=1 Tax=Nocardioides terrisoli TaxID=3388267 RepID=UPI00287B80D3|nr:peptidase C39 family protein [Nocardioides marmorisolisilvae]
MLRFPVLLVCACALALGAPLGVLALTQHPTSPAPRAELAVSTRSAAPVTRNDLRIITHGKQWRRGTLRGVEPVGGSLRISTPRRLHHEHGRTYEQSWWTSPWLSVATFSELNPSWNASTPKGTFLIVRARARTAGGDHTSWQNLGRWASGWDTITRTSKGSQRDGMSSVSVDTLLADPGIRFDSYQLQVQLLRKQGSTVTPTVGSVHAVSTLPGRVPQVSEPLLGARTLPVPAYSQMIHEGEYPQYGGGGEAWCSPTSLAMVLGYYDALPRHYGWVNKSYRDRFVDEVARRVFDARYDGTGNWPFNTAYAATRVQQAVVTRLSNLRGAERFIAAGIPLEVSISFSRGQLSGAPISSTPGHLVVIVGFTRSGDVVVNDPAAPTDATVRRTYDRAQFEAAWLRTSHGLAYAIRDKSHPFPTGVGLT